MMTCYNKSRRGSQDMLSGRRRADRFRCHIVSMSLSLFGPSKFPRDTVHMVGSWTRFCSSQFGKDCNRSRVHSLRIPNNRSDRFLESCQVFNLKLLGFKSGWTVQASRTSRTWLMSSWRAGVTQNATRGICVKPGITLFTFCASSETRDRF